MIRKSINKFTVNICKYNNFSDDKRYEIEYVLTSLSFELIKMVIVLILSYLVGYFKESLLVLITMMCTKPFIGGYHEDSQFKCLIATIIILMIILYLSIFNSLNLISIILINALCIFTIYHKAPILNKNMMITKDSLIRKNKFFGVLNSLILAFIALFLHQRGIYSSIITWTILIQVCLMFNKY